MSKKKSKKKSGAQQAGRAGAGKSPRRRSAGGAEKARPVPQSDIQVRKELYFPTHIYFCDLPNADALNKSLVQAIYELRGADPEGIVRSNVKRIGAWHSATDLNRREEFRNFTGLLDAVVSRIYQDLGYEPGTRAVCDNMWANVNPRHGYNRFHTHPNVLWSGVYYVQAPAHSGRIYFRDPREQAHAVTPRLRADQDRIRELWSEVYYEPIAGRVILFPAWLGHEVEPNLTTEEGAAGDRISISFNYVQRAVQASVNTSP
ncbi:MAG: TIGR02466 family protein [Arenicellales bacterium]